MWLNEHVNVIDRNADGWADEVTFTTFGYFKPFFSTGNIFLDDDFDRVFEHGERRKRWAMDRYPYEDVQIESFRIGPDLPPTNDQMERFPGF